jgi:hypothetical protein
LNGFADKILLSVQLYPVKRHFQRDKYAKNVLLTDTVSNTHLIAGLIIAGSGNESVFKNPATRRKYSYKQDLTDVKITPMLFFNAIPAIEMLFYYQ